MAITQQKRNRVFCCWVYYRSNINMRNKRLKRTISKLVKKAKPKVKQNNMGKTSKELNKLSKQFGKGK